MTYLFDNKGDGSRIVYLDHPREDDDWRLVEPASPHEITESHWRFRFKLAAKGITRFTVRKQRLLSQRFVLADALDKQLEAWVSQKYLDAPTEQVIREAFDLRRRASSAEEKIRRIEAERRTIHTEQERIRGNIKSLGDRSSEKELRERFVRTLNTQEDRLEGIEKEISSLTLERDRLRQQVADMLWRLAYQADLQSSSSTPRRRKERNQEEQT
jgi:hypothetical protein